MITRTHQYLLSKLPDNFRKHIKVRSTGCWEWQVNMNRNGYGRCYINGKRHMAHITLYKYFKGSYSEDLVLDHVYCTSRSCCNPTHLSPVTIKQNVHRGKAVLMCKSVKTAVNPPNEPDFLADLLAY